MSRMDCVIESRPRRQRMHYRITPTDGSLAIDLPGQPYIDRATMSARAVISTPTIDRAGDLLIPTGCQLQNFAKNPVVLWAHGLEGVGQPIASSRDPQGKLAVTITPEAVEATCWFSQSFLEAAQIFELIAEGIVKATSVRETPIKSYVRHDLELGDIIVVEEWELEEWSWCAVGMNPDAVAKTVHHNRLGGQAIVPSILKSLKAVAPQLKHPGTGFVEQAISTDVLDWKSRPPHHRSRTKTDEASATVSQSYGAMALSKLHTELVGLCRQVDDAIGPLDNPAVAEGLSATLGVLDDQVLELESLHASNYPDHPRLTDDPDDEADEDGFKARGQSDHDAIRQLKTLENRLASLAVARNLTVSQRRLIRDAAHQFFSRTAKSHTSEHEVDETNLDALRRSITELTELVEILK